MKQTAVEWLQEKLENGIIAGEAWKDLLIVAKAMEKNQIIQARITSPLLASIDKVDYIKEAEQYYNETFKSK